MQSQHFKIYFHHYSASIFLGLTIILLLVGSFYMGNKLLKVKSEADMLASDVKKLKTQIESNSVSTPFSNADLDLYATLLNQLIPESEDYFTVLIALEKISSETGYKITNYAINGINSGKSSANKIQITVSGIGNKDSFIQFLKDYPLGGGRFITSESINLGNTQESSNFILNFYSQKTPGKKTRPHFSQSDLDLLSYIRNKTSVIVKSETSDVPVDYPTKSNPF
jgi:hypothetical protein